jgi:hypothetical protein
LVNERGLGIIEERFDEGYAVFVEEERLLEALLAWFFFLPSFCFSNVRCRPSPAHENLR